MYEGGHFTGVHLYFAKMWERSRGHQSRHVSSSSEGYLTASFIKTACLVSVFFFSEKALLFPSDNNETTLFPVNHVNLRCTNITNE